MARYGTIGRRVRRLRTVLRQLHHGVRDHAPGGAQPDGTPFALGCSVGHGRLLGSLLTLTVYGYRRLIISSMRRANFPPS